MSTDFWFGYEYMSIVEAIWERSETSRNKSASYCISPVATHERCIFKWPSYVWGSNLPCFTLLLFSPTPFQAQV